MVAARTGALLDLQRVTIFGWSYGGYASLLGLLQAPDVFKASLSAAGHKPNCP